MSWPLEGFEIAVQDALKERFDRDEFIRKAIPKGKAELIEALQKFEKDTKEYWDCYCRILKEYWNCYCRILAENGCERFAKSSIEHFDFNSTDTLSIMREGGDIRFWAKHKPSISAESTTIFDITLEGDKIIVTEFNSEINLPTLYFWRDHINDNFQSRYLSRLVERARGVKCD